MDVVAEGFDEGPSFFLFYPSRAQRSEPLRLFVEMAKELAVRAFD
ncbi:hypothetical protein [Myxococcus xanthus]